MSTPTRNPGLSDPALWSGIFRGDSDQEAVRELGMERTLSATTLMGDGPWLRSLSDLGPQSRENQFFALFIGSEKALRGRFFPSNGLIRPNFRSATKRPRRPIAGSGISPRPVPP